MKLALILIGALSTSANSSPFYMQTTLGSAGSFSRGPEHSVASICLGAEIFKRDRFAIDLEVGYTSIGSVKGKSRIEETIWYKAPEEPIIIVQPEPKIPTNPIIINEPVPTPKRTEPAPAPRIIKWEPIVVVAKDPDPIHEPDPIIVPVVEPEKDEPVIIIELASVPIFPKAVKGLPEGVKVNGRELKEYVPKFGTDLYNATIGARIKFGNFLWINVRGGAEKKVIDGTIEEKTTEEGMLINWRTKEKFRDEEYTYILGASALFKLRKQLMGIVKVDYHDLNNQVDDNDFQTDDFIVSAGLRFGF